MPKFYILVLYAISACMLWGCTFLGPLFLQNFSPIDIVLGRYLSFGALSVIFLAKDFQHKKSCFAYWKEGVFNAIAINFACYFSITLGVRLSSASIIALIIGLAPMVIALINCQRNKQPFAPLFFPILCIIFGITLVHIEALQEEIQYLNSDQYAYGIISGVVALAIWAGYIICNSKFLHENKGITPSNWTALMGLASLFFSIIGLTFRFFTVDQSYLSQFSIWEVEGQNYFLVTTFLGIFSTWIAYMLWNIASVYLPSTLSGQLAILETLFALIFIYTIEAVWPTPMEISGVLLILGGVWRGLVIFNRQKMILQPAHSSSDT